MTLTKETDAELEKFIINIFDKHAQPDRHNRLALDEVEFQEASREVAAFAAKRAREKAIEECLVVIGRPVIGAMSHPFTQIQDISKQVIYDKVSALKSL